MDDSAGLPMALIVAALIPAFIGAYIGERRGIKVCGFFLGFFLSYLGLIVIMCIDRANKCPECGGALNKGARRCCHCGVEIGAAAAARPRGGGTIRVRARRPVVPPSPSTVSCPHCGKSCEPPDAPGTYACPHCGKGIAFE